MMTPIAIAAFTFYVQNLNQIYVWIIILSLSYSSRGSASFIMGQEFLPRSYGIYLAAATFVFDGLCAMFCSFIFYTTKSQLAYTSFLAITVTFFLIFFALFCPESPRYLYEKKKFDELESCILVVASVNRKGKKEREEIK